MLQSRHPISPVVCCSWAGAVPSPAGSVRCHWSWRCSAHLHARRVERWARCLTALSPTGALDRRALSFMAAAAVERWPAAVPRRQTPPCTKVKHTVPHPLPHQCRHKSHAVSEAPCRFISMPTSRLHCQ